ncbi:MAG: hypothetical protein R2822_04415 [Spirosomataceae bacterium]
MARMGAIVQLRHPSSAIFEVPGPGTSRGGVDMIPDFIQAQPTG